MRRKALFLAVFLITLVIGASEAFASDIDVKLDSVVNDFTVHVNFDTVTPMQIENSTVVPLRKFCEAAGFSVSWADESKTAVITLKGISDSSVPVERYGYKLLSKADTKGLSLAPDSITATLRVSDEHIYLKYNYRDIEGDIVSIGKSITSAVPATVVNGGSIVVPIRSLMEVFGLWVEWTDGTVIVSIPPFESVPADMEFVSADVVEASAQAAGNDMWYGSLPEHTAEAVAVPVGEQVPEGAVYLGTFRITHYCSCEKCCGSYGNSTAWAGAIVPGVTIAVDPSVIPKLSSVYIDGYGVRRAEDCGGAIKGNKIDVAVSNHSEAMKLGVVYKDVWLMK